MFDAGYIARSLRFAPAILLLALLPSCSSPVAPSGTTLGSRTDTMTWDIKNNCSAPVDLQLFDKTGGGVWPAIDRVYRLDAGERWVQRIECNTNSRICFGAGLRSNYSVYWGVGLSNDQSCSDCCKVCNGSSPEALSLTGSSSRC